MALLASVLETELRKFMDPQYAGFQGWPTNDVDTAAAWANAIDVYTGSGLSVFPVSTTGVIAKGILQTGLLGMSAPGAAIPIFDIALLAYATSLGLGMLPTFVGAPPVLPLTVTPPTLVTIIAAGLAGASSSEQAALMATWIDIWFKTGTAVPSAGGPPVLWI